MPEDSRELLARAVTEIRRLKAENAELKKTGPRAEPIAVVGMACRFPGECGDPEGYWKFLSEGKCAIQPTPAARAGGVTGTYGAYLDDTDLFDAAFFGIAPKEAQSLDPQQRLLLEVAWHALESGNIRPDTLAGRDVGVFVGMSGIDYALRLFSPSNRDRIDPYFGTGATLSPAAGRLSYFLKVNGPSLVVDTACSSALVAIHLAAESLRRGECEMALAAAANRILGPELTINFTKSGLLSPDGRVCTFDEQAQGYARGEGGGALVLKRLSDAESAGDTIFAVLLGSAINQDGGSGGLTVPSGAAQQRVIRRALKSAGLEPGDVDYVEAHGTATKLGDPIEVNSLGAVFGPRRDPSRPLHIGSVKTNFGHLEAAAGMASSLKIIQALRHEALPPHLNFKQPSSHIDWAGGRVRVVEAVQAWPRGERRRVAGVSGFGFAGTNVHLIFAEPPVAAAAVARDPARPDRSELLVLSARQPEALRAVAGQYADSLASLPAGLWPDAAYTAQFGRVAFGERLALVANSAGDAATSLRAFAEAGKARGVVVSQAREKLRSAFVFTGQGSQYAGMGRGLYDAHPVFRENVDLCADRLRPMLGRDIREVLFAAAPQPRTKEGARSLLESTRNTDALSEIDRTVHTQTGLFVVEYALARLWQSWGVHPEVALGHSVGEYAAACLAGVFDLDDALKLIVARGRLMEERSAAGAMLTVFADEAVVAEMVKPYASTASIAAVNGPEIVLVSGAESSIDALQAAFDKAQLRVVRMRIERAFHSPMTEPILGELRTVAASLTLRRPTLKLISNVTGGFVDREVTQPEYWVRHVRQSVRFCESITLLHAQQLDFFIEVGPDPTLIGLDLCFRTVREKVSSKARWLPSRRRGQDDLRSMLDGAGRLWAAGMPIDWMQVQAGRAFKRIGLPVYPYQRKRHWLDDVPAGAPQPTPDLPAVAESAPAAPETQPSARSVDAPVSGVASAVVELDVLSAVQGIISEVSGLEAADLPRSANLLEMGLDSLMFVRAGRVLEKRFQVNISIRQFYEELHRIGPLVDFLTVAGRSSAGEESQEQRGGGTPPTINTAAAAMRGEDTPPASEPVATAAASQPRIAATVDSRMTAGFAGLKLAPENLSPRQQAFLSGFIERYNARTPRSKQRTQEWRMHLADWKASLQFKRSFKELKYPIVAERAAGARLWDIDGNEYIDLALGMGVHFLGHAPAFINDAVRRQLGRSAALGPQADLAGEVARKICELTGAERATLSITGTGAVILAQRLARAATGRPLIAQFAGAYHGFNGEVLVVPTEDGPRPLSPGVPANVVQSARVLDYGSDDALDWIRENASQLAAVLVEPVQSRRPGFQPQRFLRRLRKLTAELGVALIFDEMINGFRVHAGGAQAWFGIQADLVTYGKIVGGGLPLSAVAGKARFLDWIDGGFWQFGDDSAPTPHTIFTGGTHNRHPLALAAANAALDHLIASGPALHDAVNRRTERLCKELNAFFEAESVALRASWFGSQFRLDTLGDPIEMELLFYLLTEQGFYTWEQRICCLSTAHTDEDIDRLVAAVKHAVSEMRAGGFAIQAGANAPKRILPLSSVQERLHALCQRDGAEMPYHLSGVWEIRGPVDTFRLQDAFQEIIRRHESLRTGFGLIAGRPCQHIFDEPRFFLETLEPAGRSPDALLQSFIRKFDLEQPPLLRVGYASIDATRGYLLIDVHHIAADGLSMNVILREFASLYDGVRLRPVKRQYRHAIDEAMQRRELPSYRAEEEYWLREMAGELPVLELPTDFPRTGGMDFRGDKVLLAIEPARTARLEAFAREQGSSLYMVLLAAFTTLLHRLTESQDVIVGLPVAGRPGADNDEVVGMFVNSLPLRFRPRPEVSFLDFLKQVRGTCLGAYDHSEYAFGDMVEKVDAPRNPDRNPLFDVMFAYENADNRAMRTRDLEIVTIDQYEGSGMFDFNADIIREAGTLNIRLHYATRLFRRETIERWSDAYSCLLNAILTTPSAPLGRLPMLSENALRRVTVDFNAASGEPFPPATLVSLWSSAVAAHGASTAVTADGRRLTFAELDALSDAVAVRLAGEQGVRRGDFVALLLDSSERMLVAILGVLKAAAAYVPIDPANPTQRVAALLKDSGAKAVLVDAGSAADGAAAAKGVPVLSVEALSRPLPVGTAALSLKPECSDLAYVIYTSGSTGQPKGVLIEHGTVANSVQWRIAAYGITARDVTLQMPSFAFDASLLDVFPALCAGGRLVMVTAAGKRDLAAQAARIRTECVTNYLVTPSLHSLYLREIGDALSGLRFVCVAGEATPVSLVRAHYAKLPDVGLFNEYGPTENSVVSTFTRLLPADDSVSIGRPVAGNRVFVVQANGELCGIGVPGELVVSGPGLARGYLNRPEQTSAAFTTAPWDPSRRIYRTGDRARWRTDGMLDFLGRRDGQVKLRGYRIELDEVEELLRRQPGVTAAAASVMPVGREPQLVAHVCTEGPLDEPALRAAFQRALPVYMMPSAFVRLPALPLNQNGKVNRRALPAPDARTAVDVVELPVGDRESALAEIWAEVLRHQPIGRTDDYFRLGGDSIKGIQIISRLLQRGWRLDMRWLFRNPTVATLAPCLEPARPCTASMIQAAAEVPAELPLTPVQSWFFDTYRAHPDHFNQAIWLDAQPRWDVDAMTRALQFVVRGHEAFSLRFPIDGTGRPRCTRGAEVRFDCRIIDLRGDKDASSRLAEMVAVDQAAVRIADGPLSRAFLVRLDSGDRLFWTAHHLVVDGVSWRILLEDLTAAYGAVASGKPVPVVQRTADIGAWTHALGTAAESGELEREIPYWLGVTSGAAPRLPDGIGATCGTVRSLRSVSFRLDGVAATRLLGESHGAFRTRGIELFLAAFRRAHTQWSPGAELYVQLEGHGRDGGLCSLDVSRTVGWFTTVYPARFAPAPVKAADLIRDTKEVLRRVPRNGAGFGWLRSLAEGSGLADRALPEISFNFLGDFGAAGKGGGAPFVLSSERPAHAQDSRQPVPQPLAVYGYAVDGVLHWTIDFDESRLPESAVRGLLDRFMAALADVAVYTTEQAVTVPGGSASPADFTFSEMDLGAFDRLLARHGWAAERIEDIQPLSPMQKGLYYEALNAPESEAYFEQMSFRLEGRMDIPAFVEAWRELVARHPALRSVFVQHGGVEDALQVVLRTSEVPVSITPLSGQEDALQRTAIDAFRVEDRREPFVLETGPLMRVRIFDLGHDRLHIVWSHHHIIMDGWCVGILYEDLMRLYEARSRREPPQLDPAPDYRAYLGWLGQVDRTLSAEFWRAQLEGCDTLTVLPRDHAASAGEYRCERQKLLLHGPSWDCLTSIAAGSVATTATLVQTLWGILLARYNQADDVVFGGIVSGRPEQVKDVERMVGLFINALPVRLRFERGLTLSAALRRFQEQALERRPHEYLSLSDIKAQAPGLRDLFDHLVVLENYPMDEELRGDAGRLPAGSRPKLSDIDGFERTHFDFTLVAVPRSGGLEVEFTYNAAVHTPAQIRRVQSHLLMLVDALAAHPEAGCLEAEWLPADERRQLEAWNATDAGYPTDATILTLFDEQVANHPGRPAVTFQGVSRTYRDIGDASRAVALGLLDAGLQPGDRVAVWLPRDGDMVVALLGTLRAGGCYVPLDPEYPEERLRFILEDSGASVVIAHSGHRSPFTSLHEVLIDIASARAAGRDAKSGSRQTRTGYPKPESPAYIIYTSGSTGKPKGCVISHRNVVRLMRNDRFDFSFGAEDVWVVAHSFCFDFSVWEMYGALLNGGRVVVAPREEVRDVRAFVTLVSRERVTVLNQTPAAFYAFLEEALKQEHDFSSHLRYVVFGGDRLDPRYLAPWADKFGTERPRLINMYGITETTVHVTFHPVTTGEIRAADGRSVIGRPLPETEVWVLDEQLRMLPIGVAGELYIGGSGVGIGYLNRPNLTAERFVPAPGGNGGRLYRSGDLGRWREDGQLEYLGRNDHQVQVRGFRVELGEVEAACLKQAGIAQAVVLPIEPDPGQVELVAYLVGEPRSASVMRQVLAPLLPGYMIPAHFEWVAGIPLTANGKIDRRALPVPGSVSAPDAGATSHVGPRNDTERALVGIWQEVLGLEAVGVHDNFFDLGGQSLKAVRMRSRIEEQLAASIALRDLFAHPTIEELAALIAAQQPAVQPVDPDLSALVEGLSAEEIEEQLRKLQN